MNMMKKLAYYLGFIALSSVTWAATDPIPLAVWNNDIDATHLTRGPITLSLNDNTVENGAVTIGTKPVTATISSSNALYDSKNYTVVLRVKNWNSSSSEHVIVSAGDGGNDNRIGILGTSNNKMNGIWQGSAYQTASSTTTLPTTADEHTFVMTYGYTGSVTGTKGYLDGSQCYYNSGLKAMGHTVRKFAFGGLTTNAKMATGMTITGIAIFKEQLTDTQVASVKLQTLSLTEDTTWSTLEPYSSATSALARNYLVEVEENTTVTLTLDEHSDVSSLIIRIPQNSTVKIAKGATAVMPESLVIIGEGKFDFLGPDSITFASSENTYSGGTIISGGTLNATISGAMGTGNVTVAGGTLNATVENALGKDAIAVTVENGELNVDAANSYSGGTTISGGVVNVKAANALGSGEIAVSGGTLKVMDRQALENNTATISGGSLDIGTLRDLTLSSVSVSSDASINVIATSDELTSGEIQLSMGVGFTTAGTFSVKNETGIALTVGETSVDADTGVITIAVSSPVPVWTATGTNDNWSDADHWSTTEVPTSGKVILNFGSGETSQTLTFDATNTVTLESLSFIGSAGGSIVYANTNTLSVLVMDVGTNVTLPASILTSEDGTCEVVSGVTLNLLVDDATPITISGKLQGAGSIEKTGNGTLNLSGANTYTGTTTISEGTLKLTNATMSATPITIVTGATLDLAQTTETTFSNTISGAGNVTVSSTVVKLSTLGSTGTLTIAEGATLDVTALTEDAPLSNAIVLEGTLRYAGTGDAGIVTGNISSTTAKGTLDVTNGGLSLFGTMTNYQGSINVATGSKLFTKDTITLGNAATLNLQGTIVGGAYAARYVRWTPLARPTSGNNHTGVALAEFKFLLNGEAVPWDTTTISIASDHISSSHVANNLKDGNITSTKWYWETSMETFSNTECPVVFDAGENKTLTFNGYNLAMADQNGRNPTKWTLEISDDNSTWVTIDTRTYTDAEVLLWNTWAWLTTPFTLEGEATLSQLKVEGTLSGSGLVGMPVTFGNEAKLDASEGPVTVQSGKSLTLNGTVTTTLPTDAPAETYLIKCGTTTPSDALKFACTGTELCVAPSTTGYQLVAAPTVNEPTGVTLSDDQKKDVQDVAAANGITEDVTLTGKTSASEDPVSDDALTAMLECFDGGTLKADTENSTVSIVYDFGISVITIKPVDGANYIVVTAKVAGEAKILPTAKVSITIQHDGESTEFTMEEVKDETATETGSPEIAQAKRYFRLPYSDIKSTTGTYQFTVKAATPTETTEEE